MGFGIGGLDDLGVIILGIFGLVVGLPALGALGRVDVVGAVEGTVAND